MAHRGCARDVLFAGLLSELSPGARASVAYRPGRVARPALNVMAPDRRESTNPRPIPTPRWRAVADESSRPGSEFGVQGSAFWFSFGVLGTRTEHQNPNRNGNPEPRTLN